MPFCVKAVVILELFQGNGVPIFAKDSMLVIAQMILIRICDNSPESFDHGFFVTHTQFKEDQIWKLEKCPHIKEAFKRINKLIEISSNSEIKKFHVKWF